MLSNSIQLLKAQGIVVYALQSMNPVEGEAVIAEVLQKFQGTVELVDVTEKIPWSNSFLPGVAKLQIIPCNVCLPLERWLCFCW